MKNILVTGNGFDLTFNLKTQYKDFFNSMMNLEEFKNINDIIELYETNFTNIAITEYVKVIKIFEINWKELIIDFENTKNIFDTCRYGTNWSNGICVNENIANKYTELFDIDNDTKHYKWKNDFSFLIKRKNISNINNTWENSVTYYNGFKDEILENLKIISRLVPLVTLIEEFYNEMANEKYLLIHLLLLSKFDNDQLNNSWTDIELQIHNFVVSNEKNILCCNSQELKKVYEIIEFLCKIDVVTEIKSNLFENIKDIEINFDNYISQIMEKFSTTNYEKNETLINFLKNIDFQLNFNYSDTLSKLRGDGFEQVRYIHNKYGNKENDNKRIIFGIDNFENENKPIEEIFTNITKEYRITHSYNTQTINLPTNNDKINISFWGHGLGKADHAYFDAMFKYYDVFNNSNVKLTFYYYNETENINEAYDLIKKISNNYQTENNRNTNLTKLILENRLHFIPITNLVPEE